MFINIKPLISKFAQRPEITLLLDEQYIKTNWDKIIAETISQNAVGKCFAVDIRNKTLIVRAANHLWLQEISFYKSELDKKVSKYNKNITSIKLVL